jgi:carbon storage regulator CsrA
MLVVSRKSREVIVVGASNGFEQLLKITILAIENGNVRLGFEAADDVAVDRLEVWERTRACVPSGGSMESVEG